MNNEALNKKPAPTCCLVLSDVYFAVLTHMALQDQFCRINLCISLSSKRVSEGGRDEEIHRTRTGIHPRILSPPTSPVDMDVHVGGRSSHCACVCAAANVRAVYMFSTACRSGSPLPLNRWGSVLWALNSQHSGQMVRLSATLCVWVCECVCVASGRRHEVNICQKAKRQLVVWGTLE